MSILSVDLAYRRYRDIGIVVLRSEGDRVVCELVRCEECDFKGEPEINLLAGFFSELARERQARYILIDGPQAWAPGERQGSRDCERRLNTPGRTGPPGLGKPTGYLPFIQFSIALFDRLHALGWPRLREAGQWPAAIEAFPTAAWRALGLPPLPSKARLGPDDLQSRLIELEKWYGLVIDRRPGHDELQAIVAGLGGLGLEGGTLVELVGLPPFLQADTWREGYILLPVRRSS
jgi:hypothetical protein